MYADDFLKSESDARYGNIQASEFQKYGEKSDDYKREFKKLKRNWLELNIILKNVKL